MKQINRIVSILLATLLLVPLVSCAPAVSAAPTSAPTSEPVQTAALIATPMPKATPVPTLSTEEEKEVLNQQFQDFLNKEGAFTEEIMDYNPIYSYGRTYEDGSDLGILRIFTEETYREMNDKLVITYGYLFDTIKDENNNIGLVMGFDGNDGSRFITILTVLSDAYDYARKPEDGDIKDRMVFCIGMEASSRLDYNYIDKLITSDIDKVSNYINTLEGQRVATEVPARKNKLDEKTGGIKIFWDESNQRLNFTFNLIGRLAKNGIDTSIIGSSGKEIQLIDSVDDLDNLDFENAPIIIGLRYANND